MIHATHQLFIHYTAGTVSVVNGVSRIIMKEWQTAGIPLLDQKSDIIFVFETLDMSFPFISYTFCILSICSPLFCGLQLTIDIHLHELGAVDLDFGIKKTTNTLSNVLLVLNYWPCCFCLLHVIQHLNNNRTGFKTYLCGRLLKICYGYILCLLLTK